MGNEELVQAVEDLARKIGFECVGRTKASELNVREEVRNMCAADRCASYDRNWACPPGCGTLEEFAEQFAQRNDVVIFETVAELEDEFDIDEMMDSADRHKERVWDFAAAVHELAPDCLVLGAGGCTLCDDCAYPDAPCRFPEKHQVSMEAAGLVVSDVCKAADIPYNHGPNRLAYVSCAVF